MRFILTTTFILLTAAALSQPRQKMLLDNDWRFAFGHAADAEKDFNFSLQTIFSKTGGARGTAIDPAFNDSGWRTLNLPHDWAVELPFVEVDNFDVMAHGYKPVGGRFPETSIGWYRKKLTIPASDSGKRFRIEFDGIFRDAMIWINGFFVGNNMSGYVGNSYDITDYINFHRENIIVVRVDATQYEGWFYEGAGIYRHVWLHTYDNLHLEHNGVFVYAEKKNKQWELNIESPLINRGVKNVSATVVATLNDREGNELLRSKPQKINLSPGTSPATVKHRIEFSNPHLWELDDPYLYRVNVFVMDGDEIVDSYRQRFGFRTVEIKANGVFLNGRHVKLLGVNCHQDHAGVGSALPDYLQFYRIRQLKNLGVNSYRSSHNAPTPELLDACDSLGMLVMDEQRLLNSSPEYLDQFERLLKRDRSRTSVFMWCIGNEEGWVQTNSFGKRIAQTLMAKQRELDPTRTSTYAADLPNVHHGINEVIPVRSFNYRQFAVADYHRDHPEQPIIGTEMGSTVTTRGEWTRDSIRGYLPDQDLTAPWWASRAEEWWPLAANNDFWLGGYVWTGFDYRGEPTPFQWPNINSHFGIMDMCGSPKNIYYYYQSWWTDKDILHISPHWNAKDKEDGEVDVWVNSNAESVEIFLNGKSYGSKEMPRNSHLKWRLPYQPGKLEAVAIKGGRKFSAVRETSGAAAEIVVSPYRTTILADGRDVTVINISAVDSQGREVPDADMLVRFSVAGNGKIIGVGNGDPSSHEPDICEEGKWQHSLFNGKCQVILQSGTAPDKIKFEARAEGLWSGSTGIHTVSPGSVNTISRDRNYASSRTSIKSDDVKMLGADISFLPQLEARGMKFYDDGVEKDAIEILKDHGFNYVRLRLFHNPARDSGYSPNRGFCDLQHTLAMAKRVKDAGMKLLLDFHYSDYWADPEKQYKPAAWRGLDFENLKKALYNYTRDVILAMQQQGTLPDMVQVGNEINHGMIWPEGHVSTLDSLAQLVQAGTDAVLDVDNDIVMMLHVALGGQPDESVFFIENMLHRGVHFDVIGLSWYPKWHGTLDELRDNLALLSRNYNRDVYVVEYSHRKKDVNRVAFTVPNGRGKGTCIWEPLNTWEKIFDENGNANELILEYDEIKREFL